VGHKYRDLILQVGGLDMRLTILLCKKITVVKSKEVKTGWYNSQEWTNLAEPFKEGYFADDVDPIICLERL
jgi:hypothetical protein